jgi:hypothetical protein
LEVFGDGGDDLDGKRSKGGYVRWVEKTRRKGLPVARWSIGSDRYVEGVGFVGGPGYRLGCSNLRRYIEGVELVVTQLCSIGSSELRRTVKGGNLVGGFGHRVHSCEVRRYVGVVELVDRHVDSIECNGVRSHVESGEPIGGPRGVECSEVRWCIEGANLVVVAIVRSASARVSRLLESLTYDWIAQYDL